MADGYLGGHSVWGWKDSSLDHEGYANGQSDRAAELGSHADPSIRLIGKRLGEVEIEIARLVHWSKHEFGTAVIERMAENLRRANETQMAFTGKSLFSDPTQAARETVEQSRRECHERLRTLDTARETLKREANAALEKRA